MNWAEKRRFVVLIILGAIVVALISVITIATVYKTPSCSDGVQNQGEQGVDCGGSCAYLCTALEQPPTVLYTQILTNGGRTDVVASVENKNTDAAAKAVPYTLSLYGADHTLISQTQGTIDLPPSAAVVVFVPGVAGSRPVTTSFLSIEPSAPAWYRLASDPRIMPAVERSTFGGTIKTPRVETVFTNQTPFTVTNVRAIVLVRGEKGVLIAASSTVIPSIPALGRATAVFTWDEPFTSVPLSLQILPSVPLP